MTYDLHLHSCLSPCADDEMTPAAIAGFAKLNGIELAAITDHNSAENLPAFKAACDNYGVKMLPGIEINTEEEIHLLAYFKTVEAALSASEVLYQNLAAFPYDTKLWGRQIVMDECDNILAEKEKLLTGAVLMDIYAINNLCKSLGGLVVPAHVDKDSYSLLSVLGFAPEDIPFAAFEVRRPEHSLEKLLASGRLPSGREIFTSSDAHTLLEISEHPRSLAKNSVIWGLLA